MTTRAPPQVVSGSGNLPGGRAGPTGRAAVRVFLRHGADGAAEDSSPSE